MRLTRLALWAFLSISMFACKTRAFNSDVRGEIYPEPKEFKESANPATREEILKRVAALKETEILSSVFSIPAKNYSPWVLQAVTPLNMGRKSFMEKDIGKYGADEYIKFTKVVLAGLTTTPQASLPPLNAQDIPVSLSAADKYKDVHIMTQFNVAIEAPKSRGIRKFENVFADETRLDNETPGTVDSKYAKILASNTLKDIVSIYSIPEIRPLKTEKGESIWGKYAMYAVANKLPAMMQTWQAQIDSTENAFRSSKNEKEFVESVSRLYVKCVALHPFRNGNGRSCRLWMVHAMARNKVPFPLLWSGDDFLLDEKEFASRFVQGVAEHRRLNSTLAY